MDTTFPDGFSAPQRRDKKDRLEKNESVFWEEGAFKYPTGEVLSISGGGVIILRCSWVVERQGSGLGWNFLQNIPDSLGTQMQGAGMKLPQ